MDEQATFETRAVLAPRRARLSRLALLLPVVALVATTWAGLSGDRSIPSTAALPPPSAVDAPSLSADGASPSAAPEVPGWERPATALGLDVHRLEDVQPRALDRAVIAISGWYVATAVTGCPQFVVISQPAALPEVRRDVDPYAWCDRAGVLYGSRPDYGDRLPTNNLEDDRLKSARLPAVAATLLTGVVAPLELEIVGGDATEVIVIGHFTESGDGCGDSYGCRRELVIDYVAWAPGWQAGILLGPG